MGADVLLGMAVSYEAQCRFVQVVWLSHEGWDQTPTVALGAALGCARLMGLSEESAAHAIALAIAPNIAAFERWMDVPEIWKPQTRETADHSLPCTVAMALLDGTITVDMMERERYRDPDVLELMAKCSIELPDDIERLAPATRCCRLVATLESGETVAAEYRRSIEDDVADQGGRRPWRNSNGSRQSCSNRHSAVTSWRRSINWNGARASPT